MNSEGSFDDSSEPTTLPIRKGLHELNELRPHVGTLRKIRVETRCSCHPSLNGYLLGLSSELGLMHCFHDFMPDGYTVFRVADVTSVRSNEYERHWDRILSNEGLLSGLDKTLSVELTDMSRAIESISNQFQTMIIEVEIPEEEIEEFYIGQVLSLDLNEVEFDHFDGLGHWETDPAAIPLDEIAVIQFDTPYANIFSKYLNGARPMKTEQPL